MLARHVPPRTTKYREETKQKNAEEGKVGDRDGVGSLRTGCAGGEAQTFQRFRRA